jgi:hypothetical protein
LIWQNIATHRGPAPVFEQPDWPADTENSIVAKITGHNHYTLTRIQWTCQKL